MFGMTISGVLFVLGTVVLFAWGVWMGYKGIMADAPELVEGFHALGAPGTYDEHCRIGDKSCAEDRKEKAA
ncbi:MAG: hypothetical protein HZA24_09270 [Nitrospirae bacterium]|nr:hypothetical protein [Nitrospirota bacterium]